MTQEPINLLELITHASLIVQIIMGILMASSLLCWILIFRFSGRLGVTQKHDKQFEDWFWSGSSLAKMYQGIQGEREKYGLEQVFYLGYLEYLKIHKKFADKNDTIEGVERKLRSSLGRQQQDLESGLSLLASIGSVSPYIGLLGTVWGIMNAFIGLSQSDQASLASVAPGIAEALIATAMGLFAAIPAVLAYNHFSAKSSQIYEARALFCDDVLSLLNREITQAQHLSNANPSHNLSQNPMTQNMVQNHTENNAPLF